MLRTAALIVTVSAALTSGCATTAPSVVQELPRDQRPPEYQPKRVGPSAMQAWIAPWEDATGDLYPPSTVYIEVNPDAWQYGGGQVTVLRPLQVEQRPPQAPSPAGAMRPPTSVDLTPYLAPERGA